MWYKLVQVLFPIGTTADGDNISFFFIIIIFFFPDTQIRKYQYEISIEILVTVENSHLKWKKKPKKTTLNKSEFSMFTRVLHLDQSWAELSWAELS